VGPRSLFGDWPNLQELRLARLTLRIDSPLTYANRREHTGQRLQASCPLVNVSLEKVRIVGRIYHLLEGAYNHLTHLSLVTLGSLQLRDLCQVLTEHGQTLEHLTLIGNQIIDVETADDDGEAGWSGGNSADSWDPRRRARNDLFDRSLAHCVNLTHLSIEPGSLPVHSPSMLFHPLKKLDVLQFSKKDAGGYDFVVW
jgi:hypothetical protein